MKLARTLRNGIAGALIAALPVTATLGATRPNEAVPVASSAAVTTAYQDDDGGGISWVAIAAIGVAVAVALWLILDDDDDDEGALSPG